MNDTLIKIRELLSEADGLLIGAGAGIGVDSGLPDFRGDEGFWKAYPQFKHLGLGFMDLANPKWFHRDSKRAWGFYGHRLNLYRETVPHEGFHILKAWGDKMPQGSFVFTSNVDGQFQKAGFAEERIVECHGSIRHLQCCIQCCDEIWPVENKPISVDGETMRARGQLPLCPHCENMARPNILMFGDSEWVSRRARFQDVRYQQWLQSMQGKKMLVIELGAGTAIPTVRYECEAALNDRGNNLIRINPRDTDVPGAGIALPMGSLEALNAISYPA